MKKWYAGPGKKVAIVGMEGLGHLAVQYEHAMGAEATVLSQSMSKQSESMELMGTAEIWQFPFFRPIVSLQ